VITGEYMRSNKKLWNW